MTISEYDGPTAWADMTAVQKMEAVLAGDVAECDEREVFRQAIREAKSDAMCMTALAGELRESQAEVARLRAALVVDIWQDADEAEYPDAPEFERECAYRKGWNDCAHSVYRAALEPTR